MKKAEGSTKFAVGDVIAWASSASGTKVKKRGAILAIVPPSERLLDLLATLRPGVRRSRVAASDRSISTRYLIEVSIIAKGDNQTRARYYAPLARVIDGSSPSRGTLASLSSLVLDDQTTRRA